MKPFVFRIKGGTLNTTHTQSLSPYIYTMQEVGGGGGGLEQVLCTTSPPRVQTKPKAEIAPGHLLSRLMWLRRSIGRLLGTREPVLYLSPTTLVNPRRSGYFQLKLHQVKWKKKNKHVYPALDLVCTESAASEWRVACNWWESSVYSGSAV